MVIELLLLPCYRQQNSEHDIHQYRTSELQKRWHNNGQVMIRKHKHGTLLDDDHGRYELVKAGLGLSLLERYAADQGVAEGACSALRP